MLILRELYDVIGEIPELKVWNSITAEVFQELTTIGYVLHTSPVTANIHKTLGMHRVNGVLSNS